MPTEIDEICICRKAVAVMDRWDLYRELHHRKYGLGAGRLAVLGVIFDKTCPPDKPYAKLSLKEFVEITGFSKPSVTKESKALVEAKIIGRENLTKGGRNKRSKYWVIGYGSGPHPTEQ
jgi:DNA-binding MarR family transcriptional regulator